MVNLFGPDWMVNSVYDIHVEDLIKHDIKGVIVDLDNTLLAWNEYESSPRMKQWISDMINGGVQVFILSNNNPSRVDRVVKSLGILYQSRALKPSRLGFKKAIKALQLPNEQIAVIGDQLMTDVLGARRSNLKVILVKPLVTHDNIYTWFNRSLEKQIMKKKKIDRNKDWGTELD